MQALAVAVALKESLQEGEDGETGDGRERMRTGGVRDKAAA